MSAKILKSTCVTLAAVAISTSVVTAATAASRALPIARDATLNDVHLVLGKGTVFGGIGSFSFSAVSAPARDAGVASFEWGPLLGPSAWAVAVDCVKVIATSSGHAATLAGDVVRSSGFAPAVGTRSGFVVWDNAAAGLPDGVGILGPDVPTECADVQPPFGLLTNVDTGDIVIAEAGAASSEA